jgi:hypothetical protein
MLSKAKNGNAPLTSVNSGWYNPGPINDTDLPNAELSAVQARDYDILREEFPEGPYGAPTNEEKLGKTSPWRPGQAVVSSLRDQNPVSSDRQVTLDEPPAQAQKGSIEGQN